MSKKKILLVTRPIAPPWDEASKNFAFTLAKDLGSNENLELHLMTNGVVDELPNGVVQEHVYTHSQNDFGFSQKIRSLIFQLWSRSQFDIAHYFFTPTKLNSWVIKSFIKNKATKTIQTIATLREDIFSDEEIRELMFGDLIITYSDYAARKLNSLGFHNVERVYPGIDLEKYSPREKNAELLNIFGFSNQDFIINFTGEYTRLGAIDNVVDSFIEISQKIPSAKLSLAVRVKNEKDAAKKKEMVEKLKKNNILDKISFHDKDSVGLEKFNMADTYNLCDISIFPVQNMYGKFDIPLAVVEAMACKKPVIISDLPILQELANDQNAIIIEKDNVQKLTDAILDLYQNPEQSQALGQSGRKFCEENFDIKKVAAKY